MQITPEMRVQPPSVWVQECRAGAGAGKGGDARQIAAPCFRTDAFDDARRQERESSEETAVEVHPQREDGWQEPEPLLATALRMVAGLEDISEGVLRIGERVVNHVPSKDRDIAMVFQSYALYPHLTVYDNIAFGLKLKKVPKDEIEKRVNDAARVLGLDAYLKRKPRALSGGQRQRVAMGRAIVRNPQAFLMDEPLSNLDAKLRVQMRADIAALQRRLSVTTLYVTHDQVEAMTMGHRVAVLSQGRLQQCDTPRVLYDSPHSGRYYPPDFALGAPLEAMRRGEDAFVDELLLPSVDEGAVLLVNEYPRCYIDVNRAAGNFAVRKNQRGVDNSKSRHLRFGITP